MKTARVIDSKKLLGVCIPTYNRRNMLAQYLKVLIPQVRRYGYPIYISDNSSNADTSALVRKLSKVYRNIHYHRNGRNVGMGGNMRLAIKMADTEYVWMTSDDDMVMYDAIEVVRRAILEGNDFVQVNAVGYDGKLEKQTAPQVVKETEDREFTPGEHNQFLLHSKNYETYGGGIIIRKSLIIGYLDSADMNDKVNEFYINAAAYLRGIINARGKYIAKPLIKIRSGNPSYSDEMMDIEYVYHPRLLCELPKAYSRKTVDEVLKRTFIGMLIPIMHTREKNRHPFGYYYNYIKNSPGVSGFQKAALAAFLIMPPQVLQACAVLYSKFLRLVVAGK